MKTKKSNLTLTSIKLPNEWLTSLRAIAKERRVSVSMLIKDALYEKYFHRNDKIFDRKFGGY